MCRAVPGSTLIEPPFMSLRDGRDRLRKTLFQPRRRRESVVVATGMSSRVAGFRVSARGASPAVSKPGPPRPEMGKESRIEPEVLTRPTPFARRQAGRERAASSPLNTTPPKAPSSHPRLHTPAMSGRSYRSTVTAELRSRIYRGEYLPTIARIALSAKNNSLALQFCFAGCRDACRS